MSGETDLTLLLRTMSPVVRESEYVFCVVPQASPATATTLHAFNPLCTFREEEGLTLVLTRAQADAAGMRYDAVFRCVTLAVQSSLVAVGFLAAVTRVLAERGIPVNPVSAFYHDHLFVPADRVDDALAALRALADGT